MHTSPFTTDDLKRVHTVVTHSSCADGIASALIIHDVLPEASLVFVQYNAPEHRELRATEGMLFCDMTPPPARAQEFVDAGAVVLDHHEKQEEIVRLFGARGVYADAPGVSGAMLAYQHVWRALSPFTKERQPGLGLENEIREMATLAGIRDTWQKADPRWGEACAQGEALKFWPFPRWLAAAPAGWAGLLEIGPVLIERTADEVARALARSFRFTSERGLRVLCFEGTWLTSDAAEAMGTDIDLLVGWGYHVDPTRGPQLVLSCRTRGESFDVGAFAKAHPGGGGHKKAGGFQVSVDVAAPNPYAAVRQIVDEYERR